MDCLAVPQVLITLYKDVLRHSILPKLPLSNSIPPSRGGWESDTSDPCLDHWFFVSCNEGQLPPFDLDCAKKFMATWLQMGPLIS